MFVCVCARKRERETERHREREECESPRVSYSSAKVSFPFFTSHLSTLLFQGHVSRTAACSHTQVRTLQHAKAIGNLLKEREETCIFYDAPAQ